LKVKAVHPENGDVDQATITVNPTTQTYSADCYAKVEFVGNNVTHVAIQFAAVGTEIFGGFFATTDNNAVLALDNYTITSIKSTNLPFIVTETGFESGELSPFTVETRFNADNQFLGILTVDPDKVINGALSVYAGFDATNLTDKWGKLLGLDFQFEKGTYAIQFRYKVHAASENYFYLEVGGASGKYVRFDGDKIVEASSGVNDKRADGKRRRKRADVFRYDERNKSIADRIRATRRMQPFAGISAHSHTDDMAYGSHARGGRIFAYIYRTMAGAYAFVPVSGQSG